MTDQHTAWANKANRRNEWADAAEKRAEAMLSSRNTDWAFISQPGHIPARAAEIAKSDRAYQLLAKAKAHRAKAENLQAMSERRKGDAEAERQAMRDANSLKAGDAARSVHYGACTIVKVNAKTYRIRMASGFETTTDKAWVK